MAKAQDEAKASDTPTTGQKEAGKEVGKEKETRTTDRGKHSELAKHPTQSRPNETLLASRRLAPLGREGNWGQLARVRDEFDRLFDQISRGWLGIPTGRGETSGWGLDMREDENNVTIRAEAPGFEPGDFDIQVRGDQLVMSATSRSEEEEEGSRGWQRHEFYEMVVLPSGVAANKVKATYRQGVLTVTLPKSEEMKANRINVEG
jgi:HSP20 family protein